jgi:hypothetical protein
MTLRVIQTVRIYMAVLSGGNAADNDATRLRTQVLGDCSDQSLCDAKSNWLPAQCFVGLAHGIMPGYSSVV